MNTSTTTYPSASASPLAELNQPSLEKEGRSRGTLMSGNKSTGNRCLWTSAEGNCDTNSSSPLKVVEPERSGGQTVPNASFGEAPKVKNVNKNVETSRKKD